MTFEEIKKNVFKDFLKWLEAKKIGDHFDTTVWAIKCWDFLYDEYVNEMKTRRTIDSVINNITVEELKNITKEREEKIKKTEEELSQQAADRG